MAERARVIDIGGVRHTVYSDDDYLEHVGTTFEPDMIELYSALITSDMNVLDVGANIGMTSLLFGRLAAHVSAFEPLPSTADFLRKNLKLADLANVSVFECALGRDHDRLPLTRSSQDRSGAFISNLTSASAGHVTDYVQVVPLDDWVEDEKTRIDFMKIDVEGFELHVLDGGKNAIARDRPTLVLEMNHWCLNAFQRTSLPDFLDALRSRFPILIAVDGHRGLNLHDASESYTVMYEHILHQRFMNVVASFDASTIERIHRSR